MSSRSEKRKRWSSIKNVVVNDMQNLAINCADFNYDLQEAKEFFTEMLKSMEEKQSELFAPSVGLEEKFGEIIDVLKGGKPVKVGESSKQNAQLPTAYSEDVSRFLTETSISLESHATDFKENVGEMLKLFENFGNDWKQKLNDLSAQADQMVEQRATMGSELHGLIRNI